MQAIDGAERSWFAEHPIALAVALGALLLLAVMLRVYRFDAPGMLVDRDYTSAIFARDFYLARSSAAEPARTDPAAAA